jgi:hypothetical protein
MFVVRSRVDTCGLRLAALIVRRPLAGRYMRVQGDPSLVFRHIIASTGHCSGSSRENGVFGLRIDCWITSLLVLDLRLLLRFLD